MKVYIFFIIFVAMVDRNLAKEEDMASEVKQATVKYGVETTTIFDEYYEEEFPGFLNNNSIHDYEDYEEDFSSVIDFNPRTEVSCKGVFHYGPNRGKTYV